MLKKTTLFFLLLLPIITTAQSTTVSGQVTDTNGQAWNNGTIAFQFINFSPPYVWSGGAFNPNIPINVTLNATGGYSGVSVPSNTSINPSGSQWRVVTCSSTVPSTCISQNVTITGASQTVNFTPAPPVVPPGVGNSAYADNEIQPAVVGSQYYNLVLQTIRVCQVVTAGACTTWAASGGGGGALPGGGSVGQTVVNTAPGTGTWQNYSYANLASFPSTCGANLFATQIAATPGCTQPTFSNLSGSLALTQTPLTTVGDLLSVNATPALVRVPNGITGSLFTATNGAAGGFKVPGIPGTDVNAASYTVQCDSATAMIDRATTLRFITTTPTVTMPDPTASGCGSNFLVTLIASGVTVTVNRTTTATFNIYNGSTVTTGATTFNLTTGQYATLTSPDNANWLVRVVSGGGGGTTTNALTMNNSGSGAASGSTFNGSAAVTLSYNTIGASVANPPLDKSATGLSNPTADATFTYPISSSTGLTIAGTAPASVSTATGTNATSLFNLNGVTGGANSNATGTAGIGSSPNINAGAGGAGTGTNTAGGAGGSFNITAGNGGVSTGTAANSNGGNIVMTPGAAGGGGSGTPGKAGVVQIAGPNAGFVGYQQGAANTTSNTQIPANTAVYQAPTAVTTYIANVPGSAPVNNNSATVFSNANPAVGAFAKMPQTAITSGSAYTNATTTFSSIVGSAGQTLSFSVEASTNYLMSCNVLWSASAATAGPKFQITGPASPTAVQYAVIQAVTATTDGTAGATAFSTSLNASGTTVVASTNEPALITMGLVNGANAGTVTIQAAAQGVGTLTIQPGSFCQLQ